MPLPRLGVELNSLCRSTVCVRPKGAGNAAFSENGGLNDLPIHLASGFGETTTVCCRKKKTAADR